MKFKIFFYFLFLSGLNFYCIFAFSQSSTIVREGEDSFIFHLNQTNSQNRFFKGKDTNYGNRKLLTASQWTWEGDRGEIEILIKFKLPELNQNQIDSAKFSLFGKTREGTNEAHSFTSDDNDFTIQRIISPWNQKEVTWENKPEITVKNILSVKGSTIPDTDIENIDITQLIIDSYSEPENSFGFLIKIKNPETYRRLVFSSFDDIEENRPELEIFFSKKPKTNNSNSKKNIKKGDNDNSYSIIIYDQSGKEIERIEKIKISKSKKINSGIYNFIIINEKNTEAGGKMIVY